MSALKGATLGNMCEFGFLAIGTAKTKAD